MQSYVYCSRCHYRIKYYFLGISIVNPVYQCPKCGALFDRSNVHRTTKRTRWNILAAIFLVTLLFSGGIELIILFSADKLMKFNVMKCTPMNCNGKVIGFIIHFVMLSSLFLSCMGSLKVYFHYKKKDGII